MQSDVKNAAKAKGETAHAEPLMFTKRIGSTEYRMSIHFSDTSAETIEDKILRLMKSEVRRDI